jgi:hypothetical protein
LVFFGISGMPDSCPGTRLTITVFEQVFAFVAKFNFCVPLREICTLDIHRQIKFIGITFAKELSIRGRVYVKKLVFVDSIGAMKDVVVMFICILCLLLDIGQLFKRVSVAQKVLN